MTRHQHLFMETAATGCNWEPAWFLALCTAFGRWWAGHWHCCGLKPLEAILLPQSSDEAPPRWGRQFSDWKGFLACDKQQPPNLVKVGGWVVNKNGYLQIHCCLSIFIENFNACLQLLNAQVANLARERFVWNHFFPFRSTLLKHCSNAAVLFHLVGMSDAIGQMEG